jgi:hypothetical protein
LATVWRPKPTPTPNVSDWWAVKDSNLGPAG